MSEALGKEFQVDVGATQLTLRRLDLPLTCAVHKEVCLTLDNADSETKDELNVCMKCLEFTDDSGHDLEKSNNEI